MGDVPRLRRVAAADRRSSWATSSASSAGLLPLPGGIGGIDGGLIGTLIVYGAPAAPTAAAVLLYRVILFWLPLLVGAVAFASLRRGLDRPDRPDLCREVAA